MFVYRRYQESFAILQHLKRKKTMSLTPHLMTRSM